MTAYPLTRAQLRAHCIPRLGAGVRPPAAVPAPVNREEQTVTQASRSTQSRAVLATPLVRRAAAEAGIDLCNVTGTGAGGRIRHQDLQAHRPARPAPSARSGLRRQQNSTPAAAPALEAIGSGGRPVVPTWLTLENGSGVTPIPNPEVRHLADQLGVRLRYLKGTGTDGKHTRQDVEAAGATLRRERARSTAAPAPAATATARFTPPAFTASGIDPAQLSEVPVSVRPALAAAATTAEAYRILSTYGQMSNEQAQIRLRADRAVAPEHGGRRPWPGD